MDYAFTSESLISFGRRSTRQSIAFATWAALLDSVGPQLIPFVVRPDRFALVPFQELGLAPVKISELIPQAGEMWVLFCFKDAFREKLGTESILRTDGFPLVLEWRKGETDSPLLAPTFHMMADLVRRQLGVSGWGLWPAFRRYGDKVAFTDDSLFGTVHDSASSIASAYGALLTGLSCAISGRHPSVWPFPTLQWDIALGRTSGVAGLAEKLSVAADCSAAIVTVAGEQRRQARKLLRDLQVTADGARYRDITIESVRDSSSPKKLAERICEIATRRKRVLRLVVSLMLCLVALTVLSVLCWLDSNRTVIVPYADYVDSYGLPEGIAPLEAGSLKGRNVHYRFEYRGYSLGPSIHADHVTAPFLQRLGFHRVLRRVVQSHSSGAPIRLESCEDTPRPPVQEFEYEQDWPNVAKRVKRILHRDVTGVLLKRMDLNVAKDGTVNGLIQFFGSETDQAVPLLALVPKSIDMGLPSSLAVAASRVAARNPFALHRFGDERKARVAISQHLVKRNPQGRAIQILFRSVYDAPVLDTLGSCGYDFDLDKEGRVVAHWNLSQDETGGYLRGADKFGILGHKNVYSGGRLVRIEFVDESQRPVIGPFGWKICVNEFDVNGNAVRSTFLDERGIPAPSLDGVFGHREGYDASGNRTNRVFLSKTGGVTFDKNGIAEKRWKYNANGDIVEESYWDRDGGPMFLREHGTAGYRLQYDGRRFVSSKVWIGRDGKPMQCRHGVVEKRSRYDGQGRIEEEMVYGADGNPVLLADYRVAGYRIAYDNRGMMASKIWLGVDGRPAMHDGGFAETRWKYDERGNLAEERMYDDAGIPVSSTKLGYAGFHVTYDDRGLEIRRSQLDSNGQPSERGLAEFRWKYDDRGNRIEELWYTASGNRFVNRTRCMGCRMECDEHGRETRKVWIGPDGEPARNGRSADERRKFDSRGNLIEERLYDEKGEPVPTGLDGAYGFAEEYDEYDRKVRRVWLSKDGSPLKREGTICEARWAYDNYGNITNEFYLGPDGKPVADPNGVARIGRAYRANPGNIFRIDLWGMTNSPCVFGTSNVWHKVTRYDQNARITNECYYSVQDTPVAGPFGMVCWTHEYDADGNRIKWSGYDAEGARFEVVRQLIRIRDVAPGSLLAQCGVRRDDILCRIDEEDLLDIGLSEGAYRARSRIIYDKTKERRRLLVARRVGTGFQVKVCECPQGGMMVSPLPALQDDFNALQNACRPFLEER